MASFSLEYSLDPQVPTVAVDVGTDRYEGVVKAVLPQIYPETRQKQALVEFRGECVSLGAYASLTLPGGILYTTCADIALHTAQRREWAGEFSDVVITQTATGIPLRLADIAVLKNGFGQSPIECWFNGWPAIQIGVFAVGDETPISVEAAVQEYLDTFARERYLLLPVASMSNNNFGK